MSVNGVPVTQALKDTSLTLVVEGIGGNPVRFAPSGATYGGNTVIVPKNGVYTMPDADVTLTLTQWAWLQQMIDEAAKTANSPAITLPFDIVAQAWETALVVPAGEPVTIDLNGHKIDRALKNAVDGGNVITVEGTLTIMDTGKDQTGRITGGNNAANGGGVIVYGAFNMSGGTISGNAAKEMGGGVYVDANGAFSVSGKPVVSDNHQGTSLSGLDNNVCLSSGKTIAVKSQLDSTAKIGVITELKPLQAGLVPLTDGLKGKGNVAAFISDDSTYTVAWSEDGSEAVLGAPMKASAAGYSGSYDGKAYGIDVKVAIPASGSTVMYGAKEGTCDKKELKYTNAGTYSVWYRVTAKGYFPVTGSAAVKIDPIDSATVTITGKTDTATYDGSEHKVSGYHQRRRLSHRRGVE